MIKIGILTLFHKNYNWGGVLQGYALKTYLEKHFSDVSVDILQYHSGRNIVYNNKISQALQYSPMDIIKKVSGKLKKTSLPEGISMEKRYQLFEDFMDQFRTNPLIYNDGNLSSAAYEYDMLICGSDQVWNPNVARPGYFLSMVEKECLKVSYAASIARDDLSKHEQEVMLPLIRRFDYASVREKTARTFLNHYLQEEFVEEVLDPALLLSTDDWGEIMNTQAVPDKKYALAFFFSDSLSYREQADRYCKEKDMELVFIPMAKGEILTGDLQGPGTPIWEVGPAEFLGLFQNAECVFTDSFHGSVFSLLFHKNFCVFERDANNKVSKNSRLYDLLDKFQVKEHLIRESDPIEQVLDCAPDWEKIDGLMEKHQQISHNFLEKSYLEAKNRQEENENEKKYIPENNWNMIQHRFDAYIGYNSNEKVREKSSSGGLFYELARMILKKNGAVYGAAFAEDHSVKHVRIDSLKELKYLLGSKYVQSNMMGIYPQIEADLKEGKAVLFSGTPCQVLSMKTYLHVKKIAMDQVLFVDFICHGVPSPAVWQSYLSYEGKNQKIRKVNFRDKSGGWHDYRLALTFEAGKKRSWSHELNPYMRAYLSDKNIRPGCYECLMKDTLYASDITLGDAWKIEKVKEQWADDKGSSLFILRSEKGEEMLNLLEKRFYYEKTDYGRWCHMNPSLSAPTECPEARKEFFCDFEKLSSEEFWNKYGVIQKKAKSRYQLKKLLRKTGLEKKIRKIL